MGRRKKGGHDAPHGGSWKVAYADFVTAMMAFFLLMWLLNVASPQQKAELSKYFQEFSIFSSGSALDLNMPMPPPAPQAPAAKSALQTADADTNAQNPVPSGPEAKAQAARQQEVLDLLQKEVEGNLMTMQDQIIIDTFDGGVRVQVVDKTGGSLFPVGGTQISSQGKEILTVLAKNLRRLGEKVAIEGHTDALSYASSRFTNWELSTERASAARKIMEDAGINPDCILRVAGYAGTQPLIPSQPNDPRNRRISILIFNRQPCGGAVQPSDLPLIPASPEGSPSVRGATGAMPQP